MRALFRAAILFCLILGGGAAGKAATGRLPAGVVPLSYDIRIAPDAKALRFSGQEVVTIEVAAPTRTITLNAADLAIGAVRLDDSVTPQVVVDKAAETLTLRFAQPVTPGSHQLAIAFTGQINRAATGLFAVDYNDDRGRPQRMLVTQFEPADARRVAPMWDEPAHKARFRLSLAVPAGQNGFSNMPVAAKVAQPGGGTLVTFAETPLMSSYLLFLGMGDVERRTARAGATEIGLITRRGAADQGRYALESGKRLLLHYNDYFGTPYPLPKLDMVAAPGSSQFFAAMENWGAILYFDRYLLLDPKLSTETNRQFIFRAVAHEIAHQWFGNLVTMAWWDDLWLNEGFASWMEAKATHALNPSWKLAEQDVAFARQRAFAADAQSSTHAVVRPITTVDQISQAFDAITYQKGKAVVAMIEGAIGADAFRQGVRRYMARYPYANTRTDQLWAELSAASGRPVKAFADSFTLQGGVPLIRGGEPACVAGTTRLTLSQDRFGLDAPSRRPQRWIVPVTASASGPIATAEVEGATPRTASVPGCGLLVLNPGQQGYYRVLPAPGHFEALRRGFATLPVGDQLGLLGDSLALADGGYAGIDRWLALIDGLAPDADPLAWSMAAEQLAVLDRRLAGDRVQPVLRARASRLLRGQLDRIGFRPRAGETPPQSQLRETLIVALGRFGEARLIDAARYMVTAGLDAIPPTIREPVVAVVAYNATRDEWNRLHAAARAERDPSRQRSLYSALGGAADPALARAALALTLSDEATIPTRASMLAAVAEAHPAMTFDWAVAHAQAVNALVEGSSRPRFIVGLAAAAGEVAVADRVDAYAAAALAPEARQGAVTASAAIRTRARLRAEQAAPIARWASTGLDPLNR